MVEKISLFFCESSYNLNLFFEKIYFQHIQSKQSVCFYFSQCIIWFPFFIICDFLCIKCFAKMEKVEYINIHNTDRARIFFPLFWGVFLLDCFSIETISNLLNGFFHLISFEFGSRLNVNGIFWKFIFCLDLR